MRQLFERAAVAGVLLTAACRGDAPTAPIDNGGPGGGGGSGNVVVPDIPREFRGLWIATVANIDWPSRSGLAVEAQQAELLAILDRAQALRLNAVLLQVRAAGDALYMSNLEPWSRALTGTQGANPGWDPLAYAVTQAHARGIELHAWFNPFRAGNLSDSLQRSPTHFSRTRPDLARAYCTQRWFDPGEADVHTHTFAVIRDVVRRYDIDAVHLDDYFYPYPDARCAGLPFPDSVTYARYVAQGGALTRNDWRRDNVNRFVEQLQREVRRESPTVRVGISPFGIWRPGTPPGIVGLDSYASIFADSRLWLNRGWVDYLSPQLYWARNSSGQPFNTLLDWWMTQNTMQRHLWPGLAAYRVADGTGSAYVASEIEGQIVSTRARVSAAGGPSGAILYNTTSVMQNRGGLATLLAASVYASDAVVPATPWLDASQPVAPVFTVGAASAAGARTVRVTSAPDPVVRWWLVRWRDGTTWRSRVLPIATNTINIPAGNASQPTSAVAVYAISRTGVASAPTLWTP